MKQRSGKSARKKKSTQRLYSDISFVIGSEQLSEKEKIVLEGKLQRIGFSKESNIPCIIAGSMKEFRELELNLCCGAIKIVFTILGKRLYFGYEPKI